MVVDISTGCHIKSLLETGVLDCLAIVVNVVKRGWKQVVSDKEVQMYALN